ncbi:uncharacterized protein TRIADDRAFT_57142 [Trichoplax adhaerens]|uniref:glutathione-specific gamma-glutamylcyclotransferase n=1 Tax=Trichoplax adhaerens TaxID=10228 RepID=B3S0R1_TRIAD|nr:hypothetical protein TRIADDRAFT_57142 [Trichoplax adhaerens]EDV24051.1 hypothetical protein TRIADDRAFT_57142 [Trichoplax adhaerens]|eukprot:XP_002113577.1 hypothetical protein TRIADDRAFT_57142 [Trichoplax adhaerens]
MNNQVIDLSSCTTEDGSLWIFGYGSLTWKVNFPYKSRMVGYIKGYARRFWQGSTDHRGIPGQPGRVATLIRDMKEITWGVAYQVGPDDIPKVIGYLNFREKCGYTTDCVKFYSADNTKNLPSVLIYIATEDNEEFLGPATLQEEARHIVSSCGPSGQNSEYLLRLAEAMRKMGITDRYLFDLEQKICELMAQ